MQTASTAMLPLLLITAIFAGACTDSEPEPLPRHMLQLVQPDGRIFGRHVDDLDTVAQAVAFPLVTAPEAIDGQPLILVQGIVNPPQSSARFWYGPPETLNAEKPLEDAKFILSHYGNPSVPRYEGGEPIELAGHPAWLYESGNYVSVRWEPCGTTVTFTGWEATVATTLAAAAAVPRPACEP